MEKELCILTRRVKRLVEEIDIKAPQIIIKNEIALVKTALQEIEDLYLNPDKKDEKDEQLE